MRIRQITGLRAALAGLVFGSTIGLAEDRNDWQQPDRVMRDLGVQPGTRWADIGCGTGYFALRLARAVGAQGTVFAVDVDSRALDSLKRQAGQGRLSNVMAVVSAATDVRLKPECADAVLACDLLHEVPEAQRLPLVRSAVQALRPGGYFYLIDYRKSRDVRFDPYEKLIPRDDLIALGAEAGLRLDGEFHYLKYQVFLRFRKPHGGA